MVKRCQILASSLNALDQIDHQALVVQMRTYGSNLIIRFIFEMSEEFTSLHVVLGDALLNRAGAKV